MIRFPYQRELGVALVSLAVLLLEVSLTKVFSIILWYHFGFLAVSTAMLGFASAGVWLTFRGKALRTAFPEKALALWSALAGIAVVAGLWLVTQTTFDVYSIIQDRTVGVLLALVLWVTLPFFCLGLAVAGSLSAWPREVGRIYASNLLGSALGCAAAVLLLSAGLSGVTAILVSALAVSAGGILFGLSAGGARFLPPLLAAAAPLLLLLFTPVDRVFLLVTPKSKPLWKVEHVSESLEARGLGNYARVRVGLKDPKRPRVELETNFQLTPDGKAFVVWKDDKDEGGGKTLLPVDQIRRKGNGLDYEIVPWIVYTRWSTLSRVDAFHWPRVFPPWGLWGLSRKWKGSVPAQKGITIDSWAMTSIMHYTGGPLDTPGQKAPLKVLEYLPAGAVHRVSRKGGSILCIGAGGGLDVLTAHYFGKKRIVGVEINPSVVEAVRKVFPAFSGYLYDSRRHPGIEVHVAEGRHFMETTKEKFDVVQLSGVDTFSTTEAGAFSLSENFLYTVEAFKTYLSHLKEGGVLTLTRWFAPAGEPSPGPDGRLHLWPRYSLRLLTLAWKGLEAFGVKDPAKCIYFFRSGLFTVILVRPEGWTPAQTAVLDKFLAGMGFEPLLLPGAKGPALTVAGKSWPNVYAEFARAPDKDAYIASYPFNVEPPTDDRPFFFEVSRFKHIFSKEHYLNSLGGMTAHGILSVLLLEVLLLGFFLVILPLKNLLLALKKELPRERIFGGTLYFTCLGLGFMMVEIALSQKFILFLGHPFYSLAVVLFALLVFSGIGSALSHKVPIPLLAPLLPAALALIYGAALDPLFGALLHLDTWLRILVAVLLIAPLGLALGIPFPSGVRLLGKTGEGLVPWAWGVNGYASVLASVLAIVLAISVGFTMVLALAALLYVLALPGARFMREDPEDPLGLSELDG
ncbi:MAG TPA: hypothetical protein ENJ97_06870 [Planctomycetes bacterium]|nr:hypothetical protein [Planctomycetota bacterium]